MGVAGPSLLLLVLEGRCGTDGYGQEHVVVVLSLHSHIAEQQQPVDSLGHEVVAADCKGC